MELLKLYREKLPSSSLTDSQFNEELTWLLNNNFTTESIFFSINYASRYYPSEIQEGLKECLIKHEREIMKYYNIAQGKRARRLVEESEEGYDQRNTLERKDTPTWFRASFDKHLFE